MGETAQVLVALAPVLPFAVFLWFIVRGIGTLDELERRIHLEALAVAFPLTLLILMTLGLLELAIELPEADLSYRHVWQFAVVFYVVGLVVARWRYR